MPYDVPHTYMHTCIHNNIHNNTHRIEVMFYRDFANKVPLKTCKHYAANVNVAEPWKWNLLLENLATDDNMEFPLWFGNPTIYPGKGISHGIFQV